MNPTLHFVERNRFILPELNMDVSKLLNSGSDCQLPQLITTDFKSSNHSNTQNQFRSQPRYFLLKMSYSSHPTTVLFSQLPLLHRRLQHHHSQKIGFNFYSRFKKPG